MVKRAATTSEKFRVELIAASSARLARLECDQRCDVEARHEERLQRAIPPRCSDPVPLLGNLKAAQPFAWRHGRVANRFPAFPRRQLARGAHATTAARARLPIA